MDANEAHVIVYRNGDTFNFYGAAAMPLLQIVMALGIYDRIDVREGDTYTTYHRDHKSGLYQKGF